METNVGFTQIGLTAALILNRLRNQRQLVEEEQDAEKQERSPNHHSGDGKKDGPDKEREYIEHRLRELAAWERKLRGERRE